MKLRNGSEQTGLDKIRLPVTRLDPNAGSTTYEYLGHCRLKKNIMEQIYTQITQNYFQKILRLFSSFVRKNSQIFSCLRNKKLRNLGLI